MARGIIYPITGKRFGRLTVIRQDGQTKSGVLLYLCRCDCGNLTHGTSGNLRHGNKKSCGCLYQEVRAISNRTHGLSSRPEYAPWRSLLRRCHDPDHYLFHKWGAKGATVVNRWRGEHGMANFLSDMGPKEKHQFMVITGPGKEIGPENCHWGERGEPRVRRINDPIEYNGESRTLAEWSQVLDIQYKTLKWRLQNWGDVERAFTEPVRPPDLQWRRSDWSPEETEEAGP